MKHKTNISYKEIMRLLRVQKTKKKKNIINTTKLILFKVLNKIAKNNIIL